MTSLMTRLVRRKTAKPTVPVTVYSRKECCCCHKAVEVLERYSRKYQLKITLVDVDTDPELAKAYGMTVPVVAVDGKVRFRGVVNPVLLERLFA